MRLTIAFVLAGLVAPLSVAQPSHAASAPAMIVPGAFNVTGSGAFTYTIPIAVPPGTAGMVPNLQLQYSSQNNSNGIVGWGFTLLGLPSITRCPQTYAQDGVHGNVQFNANDRFCLEGQRLVLVSGSGYGANGAEYRTEIDDFSRIVSYGSAPGGGPQYFRVWTKGGQIMEFGNTADSQGPVVPVMTCIDSGTQSQCNPNLNTHELPVRIWAVNKISDSKGNYLTVQYDNGSQDTFYGQVYPTKILYTANDAQGLSAYNSVQFLYQSTRGDASPTYQAGTLIETTVLLTDIKTYNGTGTGGTLIHDYNITYQGGTDGAHPNQVQTIKLCDSSGTNCLAPTTFNWQGGAVQNPTVVQNVLAGDLTTPGTTTRMGNFLGNGLNDILLSVGANGFEGCASQSPSIWFSKIVGAGQPPSYTNINPNTGNQMQVNYGGLNQVPNCAGNANFIYGYGPTNVDFDGDGLTDVIYNFASGPAHTWFFLHNDGNGNLVNVGTEGIDNFLTADFNGDGRTDYFGYAPDLYGTMWDSEGILSGTISFQQQGSSLSTGQAVWTEDFDGDGCADILTLQDVQQIYYGCSSPTNPQEEDLANTMYGHGWRPSFGRFAGDGKAGIFWRLNPNGNTSELWLSTGAGFVDVDNGIADNSGFLTPIADVNGDGKDDYAFVPLNSGSGTNIKIYLSTGQGSAGPHGSFVDSGLNIQMPYNTTDDIGAVAGDWNNDGGPDLWLFFKNDEKTGLQVLFTFVPIAVSSVTNGIGATTSVTYAPINNSQGTVYTKYPPGTSLTSGCSGPAPTAPPVYPAQNYCPQVQDGAMFVVSQVVSSDGVDSNNYKSTYAYGGAVADLWGRGFQGFTTMTVSDVQTGIVQTTTYNTAFPLTGMVASQTKTCPGTDTAHCQYNATLNATTNTYTAKVLGSGTSQRFYVELSQSTIVAQDLDTTVMPSTQTNYVSDCDQGANPCFGDMTQITSVTTYNGGTSTKVTVNTYTDDANLNGDGNWFLGRLLSATVASTVPSEPTLTRHTSYCYDLSYTPTGTTCTTDSTPSGLLVQEVVEPGATDVTQTLTTNYTYDGFGNKHVVQVVGCLVPNANLSQCQTSDTRTTTTNFDNNGQFPVTVTNNIGEHETWGTANNPGYDLRFGEPVLHTGPNGLSTTWQYDTFGRAINETRPDLTYSTFSYTYCNGVNGGTDTTCPTNGAVNAYAYDFAKGGAQNNPTAIAHYDALSRGIARDVQGFDGCWVRSDTIYDAKGRVSETDRPYFLGTGGTSCSSEAQTPAYTVNVYAIPTTSVEDALGRVRTVNPPCAQTAPGVCDGNNQLTGNGYKRFTYSGLTTTVQTQVARLNFSGTWQTYTFTPRTTVKNMQGLVASVTDETGSTTNYTYDAFDDLLTVVDPNTNTTTNTYDIRGRKISAADPDMGTWTYVYDAFGELYQQTDAKGQLTTLGYDELGRLQSRTEPDMASAWVYGSNGTNNNQGTYPNSVDKLVQTTCSAGASGNACVGSAGTSRTWFYDTLSRENNVTVTVGTSNYSSATQYDPNTGKQTTITAFGGFATTNGYNAYGYMNQITDASSGFVYWTVSTRDAELHATEELLGGGPNTGSGGNGFSEASLYDANTGHLLGTCASSDTAPPTACDGNVANYTYAWDVWSNLLVRHDATSNQTENFCLDQLNRVTYEGVGANCNVTGRVVDAYDALGDIINKGTICFASTGGCMTYGERGAGPHALTGICFNQSTNCYDNGVLNPTFAYDADGNMVCERANKSVAACGTTDAKDISWTSFNRASLISQSGTNAYQLGYDVDHQRLEQCAPNCTNPSTVTLYLNEAANGVMAEQVTTHTAGGTTTAWHTYMHADGKLIAERFQTSTTTTMDYFVDDHLGSPAAIWGQGTSAWTVLERDSYDAWGKMRQWNSWTTYDSNCALPGSSLTTRHFTGHEMMKNAAVCR